MPRRYGQHFLRDQGIAKRIVEAAGLTGDDAVLEIGPGEGVLTRLLAAAAGKVLAVEIDRGLAADLPGFAGKVTVMREDILRVNPETLVERLGPDYVLVSNLPYEITAETLTRFLPMRSRTGKGPTRLVLMLQKEVGERLIAKPGEMSRLTLFAGYFSKPELLFPVPPGAFSPPPKVQSCVVRLEMSAKTPLDHAQEAKMFRLAEAAFLTGRKKLRNTLRGSLGDAVDKILTDAGVDPDARPEEISLQQWITLGARL